MDPVYIVVDISGSMAKLGKIHIQTNLCRYISQLQIISKERYSETNFRFFSWGKKISEFIVQKGELKPVLIPGDSSDLVSLSDFLSASLNGARKSRVLILSDGNFTDSDITNFENNISSISGLFVLTVAVGMDADLLKLKKISSGRSVYLSENINVAIDSIVFGNAEQPVAPLFTDQILLTQSIDKDEDWDG